MPASSEIYNSERLAKGYTNCRPQLHKPIIEKVKELINYSVQFKRALDIGCGAGLSTKVLEDISEKSFGIEPYKKMLSFKNFVTNRSNFLAAKGEHLPFSNESFDLITAAGAINYADLDLLFKETNRVLTRNGKFIIYDFSSGSSCKENRELENWFNKLLTKYPYPSGYSLDVQALDYEKYNLSVSIYHPFSISLEMDIKSYMNYILSETCIEQAIIEGKSPDKIFNYCLTTLFPIFSGKKLNIIFPAYLIILSKNSRR